MAKFILILFALVTLVIVASNIVLGFIRRLFGIAPSNSGIKGRRKPNEVQQTVVYQKEGVTVLRGDAPSQMPPQEG